MRACGLKGRLCYTYIYTYKLSIFPQSFDGKNSRSWERDSYCTACAKKKIKQLLYIYIPVYQTKKLVQTCSPRERESCSYIAERSFEKKNNTAYITTIKLNPTLQTWLSLRCLRDGVVYIYGPQENIVSRKGHQFLRYEPCLLWNRKPCWKERER